MKNKSLLLTFIFVIVISYLAISQNRNGDSLIDASLHSKPKDKANWSYLQSDKNFCFENLFIINGKKQEIGKVDCRLQLNNSNLKDLEIIKDKKQIRKFTTDQRIKQVLILTVK